MPIYEYQCLKCGKKFETLVFNGKDEPKRCPYCGGPVRRLLPTGVGFVFKGSGFYETDYKHKEQVNREKLRKEVEKVPLDKSKDKKKAQG